MLTTTYSILVLSGEQQNVRSILERFQHCLQSSLRKDAGFELCWMEKAFTLLTEVDRHCRERVVERYVVPAIRKVAHGTEALLGRLEALRMGAVRSFIYAHDQFQRAIKGDEVDTETLVSIMELYCKQMLDQLSFEESELLPVARQLLSEEEWFEIAAHCLPQRKAMHRDESQKHLHPADRTTYAELMYVH